MDFGFYIFIFAVLYRCIDSQNKTDVFQETSFKEALTSQANDDNVTISSTVTRTDNDDEDSGTEHYSSSSTDMSTSWESSNTTGVWIPLEEETLDTFPGPTSSLEPEASTWRSSEAGIIYFREEPGNKSDHSTEVNKSTSTPQLLHDKSGSTEGTEHLNPDVSNTTLSADEWTSTYPSRDSHGYKSNSSSEVQEDILILLRSNCSVVSTENIPLNDIFGEVGCTIDLRINISLENGTRDKLLSSLERLTIKSSDFQLVKVHDQAQDASQQNQQKNHSYLLEPETFAYLAVAFCFAFLLLLAIIVFGFRCFKKRRPSSGVTAFDVKLSSYTLTKIPRASLTSVDCSLASDSLDHQTESPPVHSRNGGSCESGLDIIPCDTFTSNREMKTFGVSRSTGNRNTDSPPDMYPQHSAIAYENHTFQRYF